MGCATLGLPPGVVRLVRHQASWADAFACEAAILRHAVGDLLLGLEHVGSTAVPGIKAKPIIDMAGAVCTFATVPRVMSPLGEIGYEYLGDRVVEGHHVFAKGARRTHLFHIVEHEGRRWRELIAFRDLLRAYPSAAKQYEAFKLELAGRFAADRSAYRLAKSVYVDPIVADLVRGW